MENKSSWSKYLQANEAGLPAFTPAVSLTLLSAGLCRVARAEVVTFFQSENPEDPPWVTPREMLRDLGEEAQIHAGCGCGPGGSGHKEITHSGHTRGRGHSSQPAGALPLCTPPSRSQRVRATSPLSRRHLARNREQSRGVLLPVMGCHCAKCCTTTGTEHSRSTLPPWYSPAGTS